MTDRRYHFPAGANAALPRLFPAPAGLPMDCRLPEDGRTDRIGAELPVPGSEDGVTGPGKRKKAAMSAEKWTDCHLSNGGMLV